MKKLILASLCFGSLAVFAQEKNLTDENSDKRTLSGSFSAITVTDGVNLFLSQGTEETVAVTVADEKYLERFKTVVENGVLKIYYDSKGINLGINGKKKLTAYVTFKTLDKLTASSGSDVVVNGSLDIPGLAMKFTSGAHFKGAVNIRDLAVEQTSGSGITISGHSDKIKVEGNSGSIFKGYDLKVDYCDAKASSGAGIHITIIKELIAKANSGGGIRYKGEALIKDLNVNSGGVVKKEKENEKEKSK